MKKKALLLFLVLVVSILMLAGCGASDNDSAQTDNSDAQEAQTESKEDTKEESKKGEKDTYTIGFTVNDIGHKWVSYMADSVKEWANEKDEVKVVIGDGGMDMQKQIATVENWINMGYDAICVKPVEAPAAVALAEEAKKAGIPYISMEQAMDEATASVLQDNIATGEAQMEKVIEMMGGKGKLVIIYGAPGAMVCDQRLEGNHNILDKYPDVELVAEEPGDWYRDKALEITETWLQAGILDDVDAIVASCDEMAIGAYLALEDTGRGDDYIIGSIDGTDDALKYVEDGAIDMTMYASAPDMGIGAVELALKAIKGEKIEDLILYNDIVTKDNVQEYKK